MTRIYMRTLTRTALAALVGCVLVGTATADPILTAVDPAGATPHQGTTVAVPTNNDLSAVDKSGQLMVGFQLEATGPGSLAYTYLGKEAGYTNTFLLTLGGCSFSTAVAQKNVTTCTDTIDAAGLLDFGFVTSGGGTPSSIFNGNDFDMNSEMTFALQRINDLTWLILLDDSGGNPNDKDFDDMGLRVVFTPKSVPEPGTLALLGLGLAGLGMARRRKSA